MEVTGGTPPPQQATEPHKLSQGAVDLEKAVRPLGPLVLLGEKEGGL